MTVGTTEEEWKDYYSNIVSSGAGDRLGLVFEEFENTKVMFDWMLGDAKSAQGLGVDRTKERRTSFLDAYWNIFKSEVIQQR